MIYHWLGWISLAISVLLLAKYIGRISKNRKLNLLLRKIHRPLGVAVIVIGGIHGIISFLKEPQELFSNITGVILFISLVFLARTFYSKAKLKAKWFQMHQHLAIIFMGMMIIHVVISIL